MEFICDFINITLQWWLDNGLGDKTADALAKVITYDFNVLAPYFTDLFHAIFG